MLLSNGLNAQSSLSGKVISPSGEPVPFASIGLKNTQLTTAAGDDGVFDFASIASGRYVLIVKSVGFAEQTDTVEVNGPTTFSVTLNPSRTQLDEVVVNSTRVDKSSGMAYSNISAETLKKQNLGQDAPYMLSMVPGAVVNSDAGNGVGYTGIRIRGTDGTRINVTINGVPVNDAESQGSFFVDMPDLVSSVNSIQVQRGVGSSVNGAGAFGASVNFQTNQLMSKPYANIISTAGSFNTFRNTLAAGTGLLNDHFTLDARASSISSDGYIDRASSQLRSFYISGGYYGNKSVLKFIHFSGHEKTYQAWNYVPEDSIRSGNRTYNEIGAYTDAAGNLKYYDNETDNYTQNNSQLLYILKAGPRINSNVTAHYTKGKGYYEQFRQDDALSAYKLPDVITPSGDTIVSTDLVRRLWLDNDFAGGLFNLNYTPSSRMLVTVGGGANSYFGRHYNKVVWARYASAAMPDYRYEWNTANKNDANIYLKTNYRITNSLHLFADLQGRKITYRFLGFNDLYEASTQDREFTFFNPKGGISFDVNSNINIYGSVAVAHKEPNRDDFVQNKPSRQPKPEELTDVEAGLKYVSEKVNASANFYNMDYVNQLVLNGQVNDVGAPKRVNVAGSYRRGVELEAAVPLTGFLLFSGNLSLSHNKIRKFVEYTDSSYLNGSDYVVYEKQKVHNNTDIAMSPNIVSGAMLTIMPVKNMELSLINKNVGRQYLDNTTDKRRSIDPYNVVDVRFNYTVKTRVIPEITFMLAAYNLFSRKYETNGYTYSYYYGGDLTTVNYKAPSAPLNFLGGMNIKF